MLQKKSPGGRRGFYLHTHWEGVRFKAEPSGTHTGDKTKCTFREIWRSRCPQNEGMIGACRRVRYRASLKLLSWFVLPL